MAFAIRVDLSVCVMKIAGYQRFAQIAPQLHTGRRRQICGFKPAGWSAPLAPLLEPENTRSSLYNGFFYIRRRNHSVSPCQTTQKNADNVLA